MKSIVSIGHRITLALFLALALVSHTAGAQALNSSTSSVSLSAVLPESVGVSASAGTFSWASLTPGGTTAAGNTVTLTTSWVLAVSRTNVELDAYFAVPAHALVEASNTYYIPASAIFGTVSGDDTVASTALTANTTLGPASAGLTIFTHSLTMDFNATRSDTLALSIDLTGVTVPAGTYTGTLTFQVQAL